ncbi:hypothetical protein FHX81_6919 [Saccharothrix saharensis]|uniref:Tetratricopeptide repeat protein n=1 Tax=Saccharothrix saharensis TaxID=571190 RepID=A0A543JNR6_9PSEU|nr:hypothetical protein [Saccharothrix saharensis]TQM84473.1 hypothetical protein FHX81_6919 [Saccharothrix saharensis]
MTSVDRVKHALAQDDLAPDVRLAVALSTTARVEPELVRAVRLLVFPTLDVGAESDFWFSEWIGRRQPGVVVIRSDVRPALWERLGEWLHEADSPVRGLGPLLHRQHRGLAPALRIEEMLTWLAVRYGERGAARGATLLYLPLKAMDEPGREGAIADWVVRARGRLPDVVLKQVPAWHLTLRAKPLRSFDITATPRRDDLLIGDEGGALTEVRSGSTTELLGPVAKYYPTEQVPLRWSGDHLLIGGPGHPEALYIDVPKTEPMIVRVLPGLRRSGTLYDVGGARTSSHPAGGRGVWVKTLDGRLYEVPSAESMTIRAAPVLVSVHVRDGGAAARLWLQPVRYPKPSGRPVFQPVELLRLAVAAAQGDPVELVRWRDSDNRCSLLLLHGGDDLRRVREAEGLAELSDSQGWRVYRARQDPEDATWLTDRLPGAVPNGVLVVVDAADRWHPRHLAALVERLAGGSHVVRVLAIGARIGYWWEECRRFLDGSGVSVRDRIALGRDQSRSSRAAVLEACARTVLTAQDFHRDPRPLPNQVRGLRVHDLAVEDIPIVVVAALLHGKPVHDVTRAARVILDQEHFYRYGVLGAEAETDKVTRLAFLATLARPCSHTLGQALALEHHVIEDPAEWIGLLDHYQYLYPADAGFLGSVGPPELGDRMLTDLLADPRSAGQAEWARGVVTRLPSFIAGPSDVASPEVRRRGVGNALVVLAGLATSAAPGAQDVRRLLLGLVATDPELWVSAGGAALEAVTALVPKWLAVAELAPIGDLLAAGVKRDIGLDQAALRIEEALAASALERPARGDGHAALHFRLAQAAHRAGYPMRALDAVERAVEAYRALYVANPGRDGAAYVAALVLASRINGDLGRTRPALDLAEEATGHGRRLGERDATNVGAALANLQVQTLRKRRADLPLAKAENAVRTLRALTETSTQDFGGELLDGLLLFSHVLADRAVRDAAEATAREAVGLASTLVDRSPWAHMHRLAAAHRCLALRLFESDRAGEALPEAQRAEEVFRTLADASPARFQADLADSLLLRAELLHHLGDPDAKRTAEAAAALFGATSAGGIGPSREQLARAAALLGHPPRS